MDWTGTSRSSFVITNGYGDSCGEVRVVLRCVEAPEIKINHLYYLYLLLFYSFWNNDTLYPVVPFFIFIFYFLCLFVSINSRLCNGTLKPSISIYTVNNILRAKQYINI